MSNAPYLLERARSGYRHRTWPGRRSHVSGWPRGRLRKGSADGRLRGGLRARIISSRARCRTTTRETRSTRAQLATRNGCFDSEIAPRHGKGRKQKNASPPMSFRSRRTSQSIPDIAARVPGRRHADRRKFERDLRWRGGARADARRSLPISWTRRRSRGFVGHATHAGPPAILFRPHRRHTEARRTGSAGGSTTSISSRSTRPSPSSSWRRCAISTCRMRR